MTQQIQIYIIYIYIGWYMALTKINKHKITSSPDRCGIHKKNNPIPDHLVHLGATNYPK